MIKKVRNMMIVLFLIILVFGVVFILKQNNSHYTYTSGAGVFDVQKLGVKQYRIKVYINNRTNPGYLYVRYGPKELEKIMFDKRALDLKNKKQIYIAIDPEDEKLKGETTLAAIEIDKFLDNPQLFKIPVNSALIKSSDKAQNITIKNCKDASEDIGIIWLKLGTRTGVFTEENGCVVIEGEEQEDIVRGADKLVLYMMGIMRK